jgi:hypothetical protein
MMQHMRRRPYSVINVYNLNMYLANHKKPVNWVRFHVLTAESMKMAVFWDISPCSLVQVHQHFIPSLLQAPPWCVVVLLYLLYYTDISEVRTASIMRPMKEEVRTSETSIYFYKTTRRHIPESCHFTLECCLYLYQGYQTGVHVKFQKCVSKFHNRTLISIVK